MTAEIVVTIRFKALVLDVRKDSIGLDSNRLLEKMPVTIAGAEVFAKWLKTAVARSCTVAEIVEPPSGWAPD